jgi:hypothetical protein
MTGKAPSEAPYPLQPMDEHAEPAEKGETTARPWRLVRRIVIAALLVALLAVALLAVWQTGVSDSVLYHVHLNAHDCFTEDGDAQCGSHAAAECEREAQFEAKFKHRYEMTENLCYGGVLGR